VYKVNNSTQCSRVIMVSAEANMINCNVLNVRILCRFVALVWSSRGLFIIHLFTFCSIYLTTFFSILLHVQQNPTYDYETPELWRDDVFTSIEPIPYIAPCPDDAVENDHPKNACGDYETCQQSDDYSAALRVYSSRANDLQASSSSVIYDEVPGDIKPPTYSDVINEGSGAEAFSDPGHSEEAIYACFERNMFHIIKSDDVKYV